jgi:glutaredoxin 3
MIVVYSKNNCPFCVQAKNLLKNKGIQFEEIKIDEDQSAKEFILAQGHRTVPQIYKNGDLLIEGGYQGLARQDAAFFDALKG